MKSYARRKIKQLSCDLNAQFTPQFDTPVSLEFGDVASEGSATKFARADHRHGMPAAPDAWLDAYVEHGFGFQDLITPVAGANVVNGFLANYANTFTLGNDDADKAGGCGTIQLTSGIASPAVASPLLTVYNVDFSGGSQDLRAELINPAKFEKLELRSMAKRSSGNEYPVQATQAIGLLRASIASPTDGWLREAIQDGVYFFLDNADALPQSKWQCRATADGVTTTVQTNVGLNYDNSDGTIGFQQFRIERVGSGYLFSINNALVALIRTNIPTTKCAVAGYAFNYWNRAGSPGNLVFNIRIDSLLYRTSRI